MEWLSNILFVLALTMLSQAEFAAAFASSPASDEAVHTDVIVLSVQKRSYDQLLDELVLSPASNQEESDGEEHLADVDEAQSAEHSATMSVDGCSNLPDKMPKWFHNSSFLENLTESAASETLQRYNLTTNGCLDGKKILDAVLQFTPTNSYVNQQQEESAVVCDNSTKESKPISFGTTTELHSKGSSTETRSHYDFIGERTTDDAKHRATLRKYSHFPYNTTTNSVNSTENISLPQTRNNIVEKKSQNGVIADTTPTTGVNHGTEQESRRDDHLISDRTHTKNATTEVNMHSSDRKGDSSKPTEDDSQESRFQGNTVEGPK